MSYSPWQSRVRLSNLSPTLMPVHIQHILTHPPKFGGKQRVASGVSMIQIYTVPRRRERRVALWSRLSGLTLSKFDSAPASLASASASTVSVASTAEQGELSRTPGAVPPSRVGVGVGVGEVTMCAGETVAYITFTDEIHLWRAVAIFSHVTIDGLAPRVSKIGRAHV